MAIQTTAADYHLRSSAAMGLQSQSVFSITCWLNAVWNPGARNSFVGIYGPTTDTPLGTPVTALQIGTANGAGDLVCWTWGGGTMVQLATGMTAFNNAWVHIAYTYDGTNHRLYRNGAQVATSTTAQIAGFLNQVYINGYPTGTTNEVAAFQVDQYGLYRRTLSADEIQTIYNAAGARHGIVNGQICRYEFDEGAQNAACSAVVDLSNSGHGLSSTGAGATFTYTYPSTYANSNIRPVQ